VAGTYIFNVTATNGGGTATSGNVSVNISDPLTGTWVFTFANGIWTTTQTSTGNLGFSNNMNGTYSETAAGVVVFKVSFEGTITNGVTTTNYAPATPQPFATNNFSISGGVLTWTLADITWSQVGFPMNPYTKQ
jgi:hypothetical protein